MVAQHRNEVVDRFLAVYGIVDHHPPIRVDHIVAGIALKSRVVQQPQHSIVIIGNGNGIVGKAPVAALRFGADKHKQLGFAGQRCVHDDILAVGKHFVQIGLQAKVAGFPGHGHIVAVVGKEVKAGKSGVLLRFVDIRLNLCFIGSAFQKAVVQMQIGQVLAHHLVQHVVGLVQHFFQMRGAFLIDDLRHKREVPDAEASRQKNQQKDGTSGREPFLPEMTVPEMPVSFDFVGFVCHSAHLNVM